MCPARKCALGSHDYDDHLYRCSDSGDVEESKSERAAKYVPTEILAGYVPLMASVQNWSADAAGKEFWSWAIFWVGFVMTPIYLWRVGNPTGRQYWQLLISTISFAIWACAMGGLSEITTGGFVMDVLGPYNKLAGGVVLGLFTWMSGLLAPRAQTIAAAPIPPGNSEEN